MGECQGRKNGGDGMSKAWSKATDEQRRKHKESCIKDGKRRSCDNFVRDTLESARKSGFDVDDFLSLLCLFMRNEKFPDETNIDQVRKMLKKKVKPEKIYKLVFES
jgi:hypothetical protein